MKKKAKKTVAKKPQHSPLFGIGTTSTAAFSEAYRAMCKKKGKKARIQYVVDGFMKPVKNSLYLVETISAFISIKDKIPDGSVAVISDSPLLLNEIPDIVPLDYDKANSWKFILHPVNYREFDSLRSKNEKKPVPDFFKACKLTSLDRIGFVIDQTASGVVLTPLNALIRMMGFSSRAELRGLIGSYLASKITHGDLMKSAEKLLIRHKEKNQLTMEYLVKFGGITKYNGKDIRHAIHLNLNNKSFKKALSGSRVEPHEIKYLSKLVTSKYPELRVKPKESAKKKAK